ncbi:MAG: hypothetical protein FWG51_03320, partial [Firmicutes bacterium]|nr:hypothetical protein [Bacillota bacterium]
MSENGAEKVSEEFSIGKIILKTSLIFTLIFFLLVLLTFNIMALFFPGFVSDISKSLGMNDISAEFAIGNYNKTKGYKELAIAV